MIPDSKRLPPPFDFERLTRFMSYGFIMAPLQHKWFGFLNSTFPFTKTSGTTAAMKRVAFDQLLFAPIGMLTHRDSPSIVLLQNTNTFAGLGMFFTFMTVAEGGTRRDVMKKFRDVYVPALKANYLLWPAVQMLNFRVMPIQFQIVSAPSHRLTGRDHSLIVFQPFVSTIGIAWTAYLSLTNSADES